jgi:hypothetical protein
MPMEEMSRIVRGPVNGDRPSHRSLIGTERHIVEKLCARGFLLVLFFAFVAIPWIIPNANMINAGSWRN